MNNFKRFGKITVLVLSLFLASCSSDSEGDSTNTAGEGTMTAKVEGATLTTNSLATQATLTGGGGFQMLNISGTDLGGDGYTITISGYTGTGTYQASGENESIAACSYIDFDMNNPQNTNNVWTAPYDDAATNGSVVITEQTATKVKGTFSFKGMNNAGTFKNITNGSFDVKLTTF